MILGFLYLLLLWSLLIVNHVTKYYLLNLFVKLEILSTPLYRIGTIKVNNVDVARPNATTVPNGLCNSEP